MGTILIGLRWDGGIMPNGCICVSGIETNKKISKGTFKIYSFFEKNSEIKISRNEILKKCRIGFKTMCRGIKILEGLKILSVVRTKNEKCFERNDYRLIGKIKISKKNVGSKNQTKVVPKTYKKVVPKDKENVGSDLNLTEKTVSFEKRHEVLSQRIEPLCNEKTIPRVNTGKELVSICSGAKIECSGWGQKPINSAKKSFPPYNPLFLKSSLITKNLDIKERTEILRERELREREIFPQKTQTGKREQISFYQEILRETINLVPLDIVRPVLRKTFGHNFGINRLSFESSQNKSGDDRAERIKQALKIGEEKNKAGKARKEERKKQKEMLASCSGIQTEKTKKEKNCNDLWKVFQDSMDEKFGGCKKVWTVKDKAILKSMISKWGDFEKVEKMIKWVIENWDKVSSRYKLQGYPTICILGSAFGDNWYMEANFGAREATENMSDKARRVEKERLEIAREHEKKGEYKIGW